jgi:Protein tyrosine and serine/threonine kinase
MLARVDDSSRGQALVVVKSLLSNTPHHQAVFQHEVELFARGSYHRHVAGLVGVCYSAQPPLLVSEYCDMVGNQPLALLLSINGLTPNVELQISRNNVFNCIMEFFLRELSIVNCLKNCCSCYCY